MRKLLLTVIFIAFFTCVNAQNLGFAVNGGLMNGKFRAKEEAVGYNYKASKIGFYAGVSRDFSVKDKIKFHPAFNFVFVDGDGHLQVPLTIKYNFFESLNAQIVPQIMYSLKDLNKNYTKFNYGLGVGVGFDFSDRYFFESRFVFQLNNYWKGEADFSSKIHTFQFGAGYRFY